MTLLSNEDTPHLLHRKLPITAEVLSKGLAPILRVCKQTSPVVAQAI